MQAAHSKKLENALHSRERFPINLEWMVDVFKYKHISSLTTHLKRHFKLNVHYKRFSQEQNKRVWTYFISVECFIGICEYVRHAARKKIATVWLRKVGIKSSTRRIPLEHEEDVPESDENEQEEEEDEGNVDYDEDFVDEEPVHHYYDEKPAKRRRIEDDEDYQYEEDEDYEEHSSLEEMEEEEEASLEYDSEDSTAEYDSSSSYDRTPTNNQSYGIQSTSHGSILDLSSDSSASNSPCASPSSPRPASFYSVNSPGGTPHPVQIIPTRPPAPASPKVCSPPPVYEPVPTNLESWKEPDWSYLHLRPHPSPVAVNEYNRQLAALMLGAQMHPLSQVLPFFLAPLSQNMHFSAVDPSSISMRSHNDNFQGDNSMLGIDERSFDTNSFLSFPDEHHFQSYFQ